MRRYRDALFAGLPQPLPERPAQLLQAFCGCAARGSGREVRLMFEEFPPDTATGLWLDMGDYDLIVVEANTSALHQVVILGHELWHLKEGHCGHGGTAAATAAARMLGDDWSLAEAVRHVAARTEPDLEEERRAEEFGRMLADRTRPHLERSRGAVPSGGVSGRIWASLRG
ncbi:toxin-antitoxin system, toxin component [Streptomyces sp. WAC06614]|uniref:toxin-antitoxin system, toxin component n=1 Tax=Streptomyces sp. WAC06614 TaxID=2487416 RepID=UPI000F7A5FB2|nr:toxin-antitoxin system, toxin component [Streptomyces sp. WAC06614]RSS78365.1 toxin-antitoxin system, toxin component [Streptomyces sp. WAC06614]